MRICDWSSDVCSSDLWDYAHPSEIMDEIARLTPTFAKVSYAALDERGSIQWPATDMAPTGTPTMHIDAFVRGKGKFVITDYVPTDEKTGPRFPLLLDRKSTRLNYSH